MGKTVCSYLVLLGTLNFILLVSLYRDIYRCINIYIYIYIYIKQIRKKVCHSITPELEGFRRPNWAQIVAEVCVSDLGGLFFGFDYWVAQTRRSRGLYCYTSVYKANKKKKTFVIASRPNYRGF